MADTADVVSVSRATAVRGAAIGAAAFLAGYLVALVTAAPAVQRLARAFQPLATAGGRFVPEWKAAGWAFLDGHFVGTTYPGGTLDLASMASVEFLYLVPPLLLLLAGGAVARYGGSASPTAGLTDGMTVALGYLPMTVAFVLLLPYANVGPSVLRAVVLAGVAYPLGFGGLGGALAAALGE